MVLKKLYPGRFPNFCATFAGVESWTSSDIHFSMCPIKEFTMSSNHGPWPHDRALLSIAVSHTTTFGFLISLVLRYSWQGAWQSQVKKAVWVTVGSKLPPSSLSSLPNLQNLGSLSTCPFFHQWVAFGRARVAWHHHVCIVLRCIKNRVAGKSRGIFTKCNLHM